MSLSHVLNAYDLLDDPAITGDAVVAWLKEQGAVEATSRTIEGPRGSTDFIRIVIPGSRGRSGGGDAPTLGLVGRLGGLGARPERIGFVPTATAR